MKITPITRQELEAIPKRKHYKKRNNIIPLLNEFMASDSEIAHIEFTPEEYVSVNSAFTSLYTSIGILKYPIKLEVRKGSLYIRRIDI